MEQQRVKKNQRNLTKKLSFPLYYLNSLLIFFNMYGLYDRDGLLRFVNSDREACLDYAELFELNSENYCLMNLLDSIDKEFNNINLDLNQVKNSN